MSLSIHCPMIDQIIRSLISLLETKMYSGRECMTTGFLFYITHFFWKHRYAEPGLVSLQALAETVTLNEDVVTY